jgi:hypothetical protein
MFVSKPDMQISIRLALQGFKAKIKYVVPLNNNYLMKPIDAKR